MKLLAFLASCLFILLDPASADEPWMYPVTAPVSATPDVLNSLTVKTVYVEALGEKVSESSSRDIDAGIASFEDISNWYAEKIGGTVGAELSTALASYKDRPDDAPRIRDGYAAHLQVLPVGHLIYRFTPTLKQVTILPPENGGDVVSIWLVGTDHDTSIQVVRRHVDRAEPRRQPKP